jgi:potassium channel LctB
MIKSAKEQFKRTFKLISIWVLVAVIFGFLYYSLPGELVNGRTGEPITNIFDFIYFSFVTILTIGYGDIAPHGFIRLLTAIEGLIGWLLFGIIVYKVVSVKEDIILKEIHNLSNEQYLSRVRNFLFI